MSEKLPVFSLWNRPEGLVEMRKAATIHTVKLKDPFIVDAQEGQMTISPEKVDDFGDGYWLVYQSDGTKPYAISDSFMKKNYVPVDDGKSIHDRIGDFFKAGR